MKALLRSAIVVSCHRGGVSHDAAVNPESGYNGEQEKVAAETRKVMDMPDLLVGVTCVRMSVLRAHAIALTVEFESPITPERVRGLLHAALGCAW